MKKFLFVFIITLLVVGQTAEKGCKVLSPVIPACKGWKDSHPLYSSINCFSMKQLMNYTKESHPDTRVALFVIRFGLLPRPEFKGLTVFEKLHEEYNIPPAIKAGQAIWEAAIPREEGISLLASVANNFHGIKARKGQESIRLLTHEYRNGVRRNEFAHFARYDSPYMGMKAHAELLANRPQYKKMQSILMSPEDYRCLHPDRRLEYLAQVLEEMGHVYATSPKYKKEIYDTIVKYSLQYL